MRSTIEIHFSLLRVHRPIQVAFKDKVIRSWESTTNHQATSKQISSVKVVKAAVCLMSRKSYQLNKSTISVLNIMSPILRQINLMATFLTIHTRVIEIDGGHPSSKRFEIPLRNKISQTRISTFITTNSRRKKASKYQ